ncbi:MAG: hypothetical protein ABFD94_06815 [Armatimonadia bacterium]
MSQANIDLESARREGHRKGQWSMKRRAMLVCGDYFRRHPTSRSMEDVAAVTAVREVMEAIRALVVA